VGASAALLREVDAVNLRQRARTVAVATSMLGGDAEAATVAVLGAAFKAGSDDVRDSPALAVASTLQGLGARVRVYDPMAGPSVARHFPTLCSTSGWEEACAGADLVLVLTDWEEFRGIDPVALSTVVARPQVIDARLVLDAEKWRAAGWHLFALGRGSR